MTKSLEQAPNLLAFERRLNIVSSAAKLLRIIITAISVLIIIGACNTFFQPVTGLKNNWLQFGPWLGFLIFIIIGPGFNNSKFAQRTFKRNPETASALAIIKGDKAISKSPYWEIYKAQNIKLPVPSVIWRDVLEPFDKFLAIFWGTAFILALLLPVQLTTGLLFGGNIARSPDNISIRITPPEYTGVSAYNLEFNKPSEIPENSHIEISVFNAKKPPKIKLNNGLVPTFERDGKFVSNTAFKKSGVLKIDNMGEKHSLKLRMALDKAPKIRGFGGVVAYKGTEISFEIDAFDDHSIKRSLLLIEGRVNGQIVQEIMDLETAPTKEMKGLIVFDTAESIFAGQRAKVRLLLFDDAGNSVKTRIFSINLHEPTFATVFAGALNEIRTDILRETEPYKIGVSDNFRNYDYDRGQEIILDTKSNIERAPPKIQSAHQFLFQSALNREAFGLSEEKAAAVEYALTVLESAQNLKQVKSIAPILWEIIETERNPPPNYQSLVSQKIQELKDAIKNGASDDEIESQKRELQQAINQHIQQLAQDQKQSGDMEIEDNSNVDNESISKALDNINSQTDPDDANAQLDALNQMLQNLKVTQEGGGEGQGNQDYLGAQKEILDETLTNENPQFLGDKQEALARDLMEKNQGQDKDLEDAKNSMLESAEALKNNDTEAALEAQRRAIESLLKANQGQDSSGDPMGRKDNSNSKGKAAGENEKILNKTEESKSRTIMQKLRELLGMPDKSEKEKQYYEDLMQME